MYALGALAVGALLVLVYLGYFAADPVTLVPAPARVNPTSVVFLSGDMGFNVGMGPRIADGIAKAGYPVLGFNSLTYFRSRRSRVQVVNMLRGLITRSERDFGAGPLVLVGQSFGADALGLGLAGLSQAERKRIVLIVLIVPTQSVYLRASPNEMLNFTPADIPAIDTARQLNWTPILCLYGREETRSLCPMLHGANIQTEALAGGHFLDDDADAIVARIVAAMARVQAGDDSA